jgi:polyketide cyclase/dehydrase/lipid transport protein
MDKIVEDRLLIGQPADVIFAYLSAPGNHAKFIPGMLRFEQTSSGAFARAGAQALGLRRFLGVKFQILYEITEVQPNERLSMKGAMGPVKFEDGYILETTETGTVVKFWLRPMLSGPMILAQPLVLLVGRTHAAETLSGLKNALEGRKELEYADAG